LQHLATSQTDVTLSQQHPALCDDYLTKTNYVLDAVEHIGVGYKGLFKANQEQTPL
jgi:hypothetical protein